MSFDLDVRLVDMTDEQQNALNLHLGASRFCYNTMLMISDLMMGASRREMKDAFHAKREGSGFEGCSSYVCRRAGDEAAYDWDKYTRGTAPRPSLRGKDWSTIRWYRYDRPVRIRWGEVKLPRGFGRERYALDVDRDLKYIFRLVEIERMSDEEWQFRAATGGRRGQRRRRRT